MATLKICKLHFTTPLHICDQKTGDYGNSLKTLSSDSMYAAMTAVLAKTGVDIPADGNLGFTISSLFPYYQKDEDSDPIFFFPQPLKSQMTHLNVKDLGERKKVKKVKWIDSLYFEKVLKGVRLFEDFENIINHIQGEYLSSQVFPSDFICSQVIQRVTLNSRIYEDYAMPYYVDRVSFKHNAGLFFIVQGDYSLLEQALTLLRLEGIGTERTVGNGFFDYELTTISIDLPEKANHAVSMSTLIPENKDQFESLVADETMAYDIERRGGWITTYPFHGIRKNIIYTFSPGSVFCKQMNGLSTIGRIVNLCPEVDFTEEQIHPIWRSGKSILLPIII